MFVALKLIVPTTCENKAELEFAERRIDIMRLRATGHRALITNENESCSYTKKMNSLSFTKDQFFFSIYFFAVNHVIQSEGLIRAKPANEKTKGKSTDVACIINGLLSRHT